MTKFHAEFPYFVHLSKSWPHGGLPNQIGGGVSKKVGGVLNPPEGGVEKSLFVPPYLIPYLSLPPSFPCCLLLTALGVLRMLPVSQRIGDAYGC